MVDKNSCYVTIVTFHDPRVSKIKREGNVQLFDGDFATIKPDFLYSLVYGNFFQRSNVAGRNKNKMSQNRDIT